MNKTLVTLTFTLSLICINSNIFPMYHHFRPTTIEQIGSNLNKEEPIVRLLDLMRKFIGHNLFFSYGLMYFLDSREEEFNQEQNTSLVKENVKAQLQYVYFHLKLDKNEDPMAICTNTPETFAKILKDALQYIAENKLFIPEVRKLVIKQIRVLQANPKRLENHPDLYFRHFHQD
ncbi:MAG: hypothetical protein V1646_02300 [bacterium]